MTYPRTELYQPVRGCAFGLALGHLPWADVVGPSIEFRHLPRLKLHRCPALRVVERVHYVARLRIVDINDVGRVQPPEIAGCGGLDASAPLPSTWGKSDTKRWIDLRAVLGGASGQIVSIS